MAVRADAEDTTTKHPAATRHAARTPPGRQCGTKPAADAAIAGGKERLAAARVPGAPAACWRAANRKWWPNRDGMAHRMLVACGQREGVGLRLWELPATSAFPLHSEAGCRKDKLKAPGMSWYYAWNGQQAGPVEDSALRQMVDSGAMPPGTLVWQTGLEQWIPVEAALGQPGPRETCANCGQAFPAALTMTFRGDKICSGCKPLVLQRIAEGLRPLAANTKYAGFWIRLVARMIDGTITSVISYIFQIPLMALGMVWMKPGRQNPTEPPWGFFGLMGLAVLLSILAAGYYEMWFLVKKGGTPGKLILGLRVVRARGGPLTWGLAMGRYFGHMLSGLTMYVGYLMAAWDEEKRSLHDRICDTRVVIGQ